MSKKDWLNYGILESQEDICIYWTNLNSMYQIHGNPKNDKEYIE